MFGRGSLFPSIFDNDPFFRDPFGHMDNIMNGMMAHHAAMNGSGMGMFPPHQPSANRLPGPVVEEVPDHVAPNNYSSANQPIVEEPDDDPAHHQARSTSHAQSNIAHQANDPFNQLSSFGFGGFPGMFTTNNGNSSFVSYSSSTFSSVGGPQGVTYSSTTTSRMGPGGVRETQQTVRDGRTGVEAVTISRGLQDKARTVKRVRDASGREQTEQYLQNVSEQEATVFDEQWRREAERNLHNSGRPGSHYVQQSSDTARRPTLALPDQAGAGDYYNAAGWRGHNENRHGRRY